jgi:VWFA-related protein
MTSPRPRLLLLTLALLAAVSAAQAQQPSPTPKLNADTDVVKISTNLIQVDVTVTDKSGKIVRDLRPEDFEIYENGQKQKLSNFTFIDNARETTVNPEVNTTKSKIVLPPTPVRPDQVRRTIALVVDDLSLSFESTYYARRALKKFVDEEMQDGDLVAIVRTGGGIGALQQFTTDRRQLYAAIDKIRWNPAGTGQVGAFAPMEGKVDTLPTPTPEAGDRTPEGIQKEQDSFRASIFATGTLGAINYVVRGMQELPGRKSIMLISDGFKLYDEDAEGFKESGRVLQALRQLVDAANRASVVIYTMDARGLVYTGLTAADDTSGRSSDQIESELSDRRSQLFDTQDGLRYLAQQTGGISIINSNDLSGGIRRILDDQSYYLIAYVPDEDTFDPKTHRFNKLLVKVSRPGVKVRYRSGFFGVSDEKMEEATGGPTGQQKLFGALTSPFAVNQVPLRLNALFATGADGTSYVRTLLHINLSDIKFEDQPDRTKKAVLEILAIVFGDNGAVVEQSGKTYTLTFQPNVYAKYLKEGLVYNYAIPVKKPGAYQLRLAIRDVATDKVGSANQFVEVPNLKKDRLVLSGIVLQDLTLDDWKKQSTGQAFAGGSTTLTDTSARQFKRGTVLNYALSIYNSKPGSIEGGNVESLIRVFRDGKMIFEGKPQKVPSFGPKSHELLGSLVLGTEMGAGDYVLQVVVTDKLAKEKYNSTSQFVQFEIVD